MVWFAIVGVVALFVAWQWLQASQRAADKRSQVAAAVAVAEEAVNRRDFDQAENWFRHARTVAADLDAAVTKELSSRQSALYQHILLSPNGSVAFQPLGRIFYKLDNPVKCHKTPSACGYHFVSVDSRRLFTAPAGVTVRRRDGTEVALTNGLEMTDLVPLNVTICCAQSLEEAAPKLVLQSSRREPTSVYIANR